MSRAFLMSKVACRVSARLFLAALALSICGAHPTLASVASPGPTRAVRRGSEYELANRSIELQFDSSGQHLSRLIISDRLNSRQIALNEPFTIRLQNATELRASQIPLLHSPTIQDLIPSPSSPRSADRLAGKEICADVAPQGTEAHIQWCAILRDGANYLRQEITIKTQSHELAITRITLLDFSDSGARVSGVVKGSPIVDHTMFFGFEHPLSISQVNGGTAQAFLDRALPLPSQQSITYSSVIGVAEPGQLRRAFLSYVEQERAHPYRTFLGYNTWYDLGSNNQYDEAGALDRIHALGEELVEKRHVVMDSFLFDDGWDNPDSLWKFNAGFPNGFSAVRKAADQYHFGIGVWLSPWGGYNEAKQRRTAYGRKAGYEIVKGGYALSGPRYYRQFEDSCLGMVENFGVNQFKFDGTGNASQVVPGSAFDSDFDAAIHLIERLRKQEPNIYINLTTGTFPSPFWLRYADSIWRGGYDHSFAGVGSWRQQWITFRDAQTYKNIVLGGPLFPLNSLMLHGIIYARYADHLGDDTGHDFASEVRSFFGSGTQLQELYITPSLLSQHDWDTLAQSARWSRANAQVLRDTHWIGGDPGQLQVYGWAAWSPAKGIIVLRNPSDRAQEFSLDVRSAFELPAGAPKTYNAHSPWKDMSFTTTRFTAGEPHVISLLPFEVLTLEAIPAEGVR